ncbi:armadillo-type protein [Phascolomyces articulosus]|uniref:Armadillo-type protein n=1 Tax=Phascolomyces articulosus TaxID=60185 RepID=A0AAD5PIF6_9FUNG|nr:armadillo-type protein [Phascolomyces articulosus]
MEALFDQQGQFSVSQFDDIVQAFYTGNTTTTQPILTAFHQHPDSWQVADQILERSNVLQAKFIVLQILEEFIGSRWKHLAQEQRLRIRNYIGSLVVSLSSSNITIQTEKAYLGKLNMVLVEIVKKEWPDEWPTFINEMVESAHASLSLCENNMIILRLLSEEVYEASEETQAEWKTRKLKEQMLSKFGPVIDLCREVLMNQPSEKLVQITLESLSHFLKWILPNAIFDTDIMPLICTQITSKVENRHLNTLGLKCCNEVAGRQDFPLQFQEKIVFLFQGVIHAIRGMISFNGGIQGVYKSEQLDGQEMMYDYTLFITTALNCHGEMIATMNDPLLAQVHQDLLILSGLNDIEILWRLCAEYWVNLTSQQCCYADKCINLFPELRRIAIRCISNPDNILLLDEQDDRYEFVEKSENIETYNITKQLLCNLTVLNINDMKNAFDERLVQCQTKSIRESWKNLDQLGWAMGAITDVIKNNGGGQGFQFVFQYLDHLYQLATNEKMEMVEFCVIYVLSQYPQILSQRQDVLHKVLGLISKYLPCKAIDIQKFATHSLVEICQGIQRYQENMLLEDRVTLFGSFLESFGALIVNLDPQRMCEVYRAIAYAHTVSPQECQEQQLKPFMNGPNQMIKIPHGQNHPIELDKLRMISDALRINIAVSEVIRDQYGSQLKEIHIDLVNIYRNTKGIVGSTAVYNNLREKVQEQINALLVTYVKSKSKLIEDDQSVINPLLNELVSSPPKSDVSDIFSVLLEKHTSVKDRDDGTCVNENVIRSLLEVAFSQVFERIYAEIKMDFTSYYDKRPSFFRLVRAFVSYAFAELTSLLSEEKFSLIIESILWGIQHPSHELSNYSLETCNILLDRVYTVEDEDQQNAVYILYYMKILDIILHTITDHDRRTQFELQSQILARLLDLVQQGEIYTQLYTQGFGSNADYIQEHIRSRLREIYPSLPQNQIDMVSQGMLEYSDDIDHFRTDLIDFMADFRSNDDFSNKVELDPKTEIELLKSLTG